MVASASRDTAATRVQTCALRQRQPHRRQFVQRHPHQRRAQHRQRRQILQRIVEQLQQAQQVGDLHALVKTAARHHQRNAQPREFARVTLRLAGRRTQQHRHVRPLTGRISPDVSSRTRCPSSFNSRRRNATSRASLPASSRFINSVQRRIRPRPAASVRQPFNRSMQFHARRRVLRRRSVRRGFPRRRNAAAPSSSKGHAADLAAHQRAEQRVEEIQHGFRGCGNCPPAESPGPRRRATSRRNAGRCAGRPGGSGRCFASRRPRENGSPPPLAAERLQDGVLRLVDVLVFIHKDKAKLLAPMARRWRWAVRVARSHKSRSACCSRS